MCLLFGTLQPARQGLCQFSCPQCVSSYGTLIAAERITSKQRHSLPFYLHLCARRRDLEQLHRCILPPICLTLFGQHFWFSCKSIEGWAGEVSVHQMACHFHLLHFWRTDIRKIVKKMLVIHQHICSHRKRRGEFI